MTSPAADPPVLSFGPFVLDLASGRLTQQGRALELPPRDLDVLAFMARRPGRLVSKEELLDAVWQHRFVSDSVLATVVSRLRGVLGDSAREPRYIETAARRGYRFIAAVSEAAPASPASPLSRPLEAASASADGAPRVGRGPALAWLERQLQAAMAGKTRVALVAGEAGIGKSSLIERFTQTLAGGPVAVAHGQCVEHNGSVEPYLPVLEALNGLCRSPSQPGSDAELPALLRQVAPTWLVQLPWLVAAADRLSLQQEVAGSGQDSMLREFGELLERLSASRPVVLVLEDLHWSDAASVQLIGYLARRRGAARVLVLGSLRPAEVIVSEHPLKALRTELRQQRLCDELDLELFSEHDAAHFLRQHVAAADWPEDLVRELHQHTGGLPLFLAAVAEELRALADGQAGSDLTARVRQLQRVHRDVLYELTDGAGRILMHRQLAAALLRLHADDVESAATSVSRSREPGGLPAYRGSSGTSMVGAHRFKIWLSAAKSPSFSEPAAALSWMRPIR
jgi:DNA-binding winged helix-turn-helix (wHTH) protein